MFVRSLKIAVAVLALAATTAAAQKVVSTKMGGGGSPHETVEWTMQGAKITITYGRPYLKARSLDTLAPAGKIWRMGADEATTLTTDKSSDVRQPHGPGRDLHAVHGAGPDQWKLVVNKQTGQWGTDTARIRISAAPTSRSRRCRSRPTSSRSASSKPTAARRSTSTGARRAPRAVHGALIVC